MSKLIKEDCKSFSIYNLNQWGALKYNHYGGSIIWTQRNDGKKDKITYIINKELKYIELDYKIRKHGEEEWKEIKYQIPLTSTACNYGKERIWFICPMSRNGQYCGKRVASLYLSPNSNYFACRHCLNLSYDSRNKNNRGKYGYLGRFFDLEEKVEKLEKEIKIKFIAGLPTKKYKKLTKLVNQLGYTVETVNKKLDISQI